jgi:hypothetical protein
MIMKRLFRSDKKMWERKIECAKIGFIFLSQIFLSGAIAIPLI